MLKSPPLDRQTPQIMVKAAFRHERQTWASALSHPAFTPRTTHSGFKAVPGTQLCKTSMRLQPENDR